ncbi:MAG: peroxide stress protein YaaA [Flavobacteriales bacterium]|nr:peroxide stress protein YaaA [Flavobacteriales bacterium]
MLILLSPAKDLNDAPLALKKGHTQPQLLAYSEPLVKKLKGYSAKKLGALMDINPKLAALNQQRYANWTTPFTATNAHIAIHTFNGEAYRALDARNMDGDDLRFAQHHLRILSGLYGVLRPLDLIQPYRLEMGTSLSIGRRKNLYAYWGDLITAVLKQDLVNNESDVVINLASTEYFKAVNTESLGARIISPVFKDRTAGGYKVVMVYAKQQRGAMARYIITHRLLDPAKLKSYKGDGYAFSKEDSSADEWVFLRG